MEQEDNSKKLLSTLILMVLVSFVMYFALQRLLVDESMRLLEWSYRTLDRWPLLTWTLLDNQLAFIVDTYRQSQYSSSHKLTKDRIDAALLIFQFPFVVLMVLVFKRYLLLTKPASFCYTIDGLDGLVAIKKELFPQVTIGYDFGKKGMKSSFLQSWGRFSMEYGPIRWAIKNQLISFEGQLLIFEDFVSEYDRNDYAPEILPTKDTIKDIELYAGKLDIDLEALTQKLQSQLGKKFTKIEDMSDIRISLCILFLLFSRGNEKKKEALEYKLNLARSVKYKNIESKKESLSFEFDRKKGLSKLKSLLVEANSKMIQNSKYENLFILSCYNFAKTNNGDITPPDIQWLMAFDRELYLLIHCYSGSPEKANNSPYIEVLAPMTAWLLQYAAIVQEEDNPATNKYGVIESDRKWIVALQKYLISPIKQNEQSFTFKSDKKIQLFVGDLFSKDSNKKIDDYMAFQDSHKQLKKLKLTNKDYERILSFLRLMPSKTILHQTMILSLAVLDGLLKKSSPNAHALVAQNFLDSISWSMKFNAAFYMQIHALVTISLASRKYPMDLLLTLRNGYDAASDQDLTAAINEIREGFFEITELNKSYSIKLIPAVLPTTPDYEEKTSFYRNSHTHYSASIALVDIFQYMESIKDSEFTSEQLMRVSEIPYVSIRQSIRSYIFFMTCTERWLKPSYTVSEAKLLGSPELKEIGGK